MGMKKMGIKGRAKVGLRLALSSNSHAAQPASSSFFLK
jgi:hypothetical protein